MLAERIHLRLIGPPRSAQCSEDRWSNLSKSLRRAEIAARFSSKYVWFTGPLGMALTVNGHEIGRLSVAGGDHGYMIAWRVAVGDKLFAVNDNPGRFHVVVGPDIYYQYDSYCYRGHCE